MHSSNSYFTASASQEFVYLFCGDLMIMLHGKQPQKIPKALKNTPLFSQCWEGLKEVGVHEGTAEEAWLSHLSSAFLWGLGRDLPPANT